VLRNILDDTRETERHDGFLYALRREVLRNGPRNRGTVLRRVFLYALRREVLRNGDAIDSGQEWGFYTPFGVRCFGT